MTRHVDWRTRLTDYLASVARKPFEEGRRDCALFTGGGIEAMTGIDPFAEVRGRYTTTRGGLRIMRRMGFADHVAFLASLYPATDTPRAGDIAVFDTDDGPAVGLFQGQGIYAVTPHGVGIVSAPASKFLRV